MIIGIIFGAFDLLHAGHVLMLEEAAGKCDRLVVGLQYDPSVERSSKNKPVQSLEERTIQLKACRYVDEILVYHMEAGLVHILESGEYAIRFLDEHYKNKPITAPDLVPIYWTKRDHSWSSSELRERIKKASIT